MSRHCIVIYPYQAQTDSELTINQDETLQIVKDDGDWWLVRNNSGREGYIPSNYVQKQAAAPAAAAPSNTGYNGLDGLFGGTPQSSNNSNSQQPSSASAGPPKETCTAQHEYTAQRQDELSLSPGLKIEILSKSDDGWWMGRANGKDGWFPHNFVTADPVAVAAPAASSEILQPSNGLGGIDFSQGDSQKNNLKSDVLHVAKALYQFEGQAGELRFGVVDFFFEKKNFEHFFSKKKFSNHTLSLHPPTRPPSRNNRKNQRRLVARPPTHHRGNRPHPLQLRRSPPRQPPPTHPKRLLPTYLRHFPKNLFQRAHRPQRG